MSTANRQSIQCPNCGSTMSLQSIKGADGLLDKQAVCRFCGTTFDVPDSFARVTKRHTRRKGLFRGTETVEEVTELRSDHPLYSPSQPQVIHIPLHLPGTQASSRAGCIGSIIVIIIIFGFMAGIFALMVPAAELNKLIDQVNDTVGSGVKTIEVRRELKGLEYSADYLAYSPDGSVLVSANSTQLMVWDTASGSILAEIEPAATISYLAFLRDGTLLALDGSTIRFYDPATGDLLRQFEGRISALALSPDEELFAARTYDEDMVLLSASTSSPLRTLGPSSFYTARIRFSPDGRYLVAGASDDQLAIWDITTGQQIFDGTVNAINAQTFAFHPQQNVLVVGDSSALEFYEVNPSGLNFLKSRQIDESLFSLEDLTFSPDGQEIALGNFFGGVWIWDMGEEDITFKLESEHGVRQVAYSPDGSTLFGAGAFGALYEWQVHESSAPLTATLVLPPQATTLSPTATPPPSGPVIIPTSTSAPTQPPALAACTISADGAAVRVRSGPGTDFAVVANLANGQAAQADGQAAGADGYTWWHLADGTGWVREDVVTESAMCPSLPVR